MRKINKITLDLLKHHFDLKYLISGTVFNVLSTKGVWTQNGCNNKGESFCIKRTA